jgi:hypothetical protein
MEPPRSPSFLLNHAAGIASDLETLGRPPRQRPDDRAGRPANSPGGVSKDLPLQAATLGQRNEEVLRDLLGRSQKRSKNFVRLRCCCRVRSRLFQSKEAYGGLRRSADDKKIKRTVTLVWPAEKIQVCLDDAARA